MVNISKNTYISAEHSIYHLQSKQLPGKHVLQWSSQQLWKGKKKEGGLKVKKIKEH